jgi:hypothetical protein
MVAEAPNKSLQQTVAAITAFRIISSLPASRLLSLVVTVNRPIPWRHSAERRLPKLGRRR